MSRNPLKGASELAAPTSEARQFQICADYNRRCRDIGWQRWYYVQPAIDGRPSEIRTVDGIEAEEVWTVLAGRPIDYHGFPAYRIEKIERRCRWLIQRGSEPAA